MIQNLINRISQLGIYKIVIFFYQGNLMISLIFSYILFSNSTAGYKFSSITEYFFVSVILAPVAETYFLQHLLINALQNKIKSLGLILLIVGLVFGLMHLYSFGYFLKAVISGIIYGLLYLCIKQKKFNPILYVSICHSMYNLTGFIINNFF